MIGSSAGSAGRSAEPAGASNAEAGRAATGGAPAIGGGGTGGMAGPIAGTGGISGVQLGDSPTEVCITYAVAQCLRRTECLGRTPTIRDCMSSARDCPDTFFSDGATRTVAGTKACAAEYATYPCDKLNAGFLPDCATPGTRATGEACLFNAQCASRSCDTRSSGCNQCDSLGELGADCSMPSQGCKPGLFCDRTSNQCVAHIERVEGAPCTATTGCNYGLYCANLTCTKYPAHGMDCRTAPECLDGDYCAADNTCTTPPGVGQPCATAVSGRMYCSSDAYCSFADATHAVCVALPKAGQACGRQLNEQMALTNQVCAEGSFCGPTSTCMPPGPPGATCEDDGQCQPELYCACTDSSCSARSCVTIGLTDEACGVPGAICHGGFECVDGHCRPRATQGRFAATCP